MRKYKSLWGAHLFVPGNNAGFLTKLPLIDIKLIIIDLEYATKVPYKHEGRYLTMNAVPYIKSVRPDINICVRVNLYRTARLFEEDIRIVLMGKPDCIRIPSVNEPKEIEHTDKLINKYEQEYGFENGFVKLHPMIETPMGLRNIAKIIEASPRVEAICLGGEDWAFNCGLERTKPGKELEYVKNHLVAAAAEYSICPIDSVYNWLDDLDGLLIDSQNSKSIGFKGRATTNPRQVRIINDVYGPSVERIEWAKSILDCLEEVNIMGTTHQVSKGVISDPLAIYQAYQVLSYIKEVK
jgi:citrate lyase subunit beta / citryl-CoA lyase